MQPPAKEKTPDPNESIGDERSRTNLLSNFILGSQDDLVNVLGILLGLTAVTSDLGNIFVAALGAESISLGAESISMGAVACTLTLARTKQYLKEVKRGWTETKEVPQEEKDEMRQVFVCWGHSGEDLERATELISDKSRAWLELMMAHELHLEEVKSEPFRSFLIVFGSTVFGSTIPLVPYAFGGNNTHASAAGSVGISGVFLFVIGYYEAKTTVGSIWRNGLQVMVIGPAAGLRFPLGHLVGALPA